MRHDPRTNDGPRLILIDFAVSGGFERQYRVLPVTLSCSGSRMASLAGIACNRRESRRSRPVVTFGLGTGRFGLIRPVHAPAPLSSGGRRGSSPALASPRPGE